MTKSAIPTRLPRERAFMVGVTYPEQENLLSVADSLAELKLLATTAGLVVPSLDTVTAEVIESLVGRN